MRLSRFSSRHGAVAVLAIAVLATSGCSWFRKTNELYAQSPESRPLEVPPDLDMPGGAGAAAGEPVTQSVSRSEIGGPAPAASSPTSFNIAAERDEVFERVDQILGTTEGVSIANRAQILGTFDVSYGGSSFLIRVVPAGEGGTQVAAVDPRGLAAEGEAPQALVGNLKTALGVE